LNHGVRGGVAAGIALGALVIGVVAASLLLGPTRAVVGAVGPADGGGLGGIAENAAVSADAGAESRSPLVRDAWLNADAAGPVADAGAPIALTEAARPGADADASAPIAQVPYPATSSERPPKAKDPTTHRGPEPVGDDPCIVPIYYDWFERRTNLTPADHPRLTVRVTVENYTTPWWLRPDAQGNAFLWAVEGDIDAKRVQRTDAGEFSVKLRSVRLGARELKDLEVPLRLTNHPTGGVFGARLLELFDLTLDYERGVLAFNDCRGEALP
jgi:hypothetical protein